MTTERWYFGNAADDGPAHRGWLVGHFIPADDPRRSTDVEIKWGIHPAGDTRDAWQHDEQRTTALILIDGRFRLDLDDTTHTLVRHGDYAIWGPGIGHSWKAEAESIVLTVRWPSIVGT